jgi:hypothetical protein
MCEFASSCIAHLTTCLPSSLARIHIAPLDPQTQAEESKGAMRRMEARLSASLDADSLAAKVAKYKAKVSGPGSGTDVPQPRQGGTHRMGRMG